MKGISAFRWTPREFVDDRLLSFLFTDTQDTRQQLTFVAERVIRQLERFARDVDGVPGAIVLRDPQSQVGDTTGPVVPHGGERVIKDLYDLIDGIGEFLEPEDGDEGDFAWTGRVAGGTVAAFMRRLRGSLGRVGRLVGAGESRRIDRALEAVTVVDIHDLHEAAQRFVVGALISEVHREKEGKGRFPLSVIVLDELNKYAPREGWSPIKDTLVDLAQRGRSLGVILIGAQQSASRIEPDVLANAAFARFGAIGRGRGRALGVRVDASFDTGARPSAQAGNDGSVPALDSRPDDADFPLPAVGDKVRGSGRGLRSLRGPLDVGIQL